MSKAVLVMDMPESCENCVCKYPSYKDDALYDCSIIGKTVPINGGRYGKKPDWCPLRELPEEKESDPVMDHDIDFGSAIGWNACLEAITRESEEK